MKENGKYSLDKMKGSGEDVKALMSKGSVLVSSENEDGGVVGSGNKHLCDIF